MDPHTEEDRPTHGETWRHKRKKKKKNKTERKTESQSDRKRDNKASRKYRQTDGEGQTASGGGEAPSGCYKYRKRRLMA